MTSRYASKSYYKSSICAVLTSGVDNVECRLDSNVVPQRVIKLSVVGEHDEPQLSVPRNDSDLLPLSILI